eukprot:1660838-Prymnesium_polylepis.1
MPTTTCSQRPTPTPTSRRPAGGRAHCANPVAARPRPAARRQRACDASYHYYEIDDLVDEARRQGACRA